MSPNPLAARISSVTCRLPIAAAVLAGALLLTPRIAKAMPEGGASLHMGLGLTRVDSREPSAANPGSDLALAGNIHLRALVGPEPYLLFAPGFDLKLGGRFDTGPEIAVNLHPFGAGIALGDASWLAVRAGIGTSAARQALPATMQFPVEAMLEFDIARLRVSAWTQLVFVGDGERKDASEHAPFGDELSATIALRWTRRTTDSYQFTAGNGYYLAGTYSEDFSGHSIGLAFGHSLNVGAR